MLDSLARRDFLSQLTAYGFLGTADGALDSAVFRSPMAVREFAPRNQEADAGVFAAARRELLFSPDIAFCNTGTLGACPREVIETVVEGHRAIERDLPDWPYRPQPTDIPPMSGYLPLVAFREEVGAILNAPPEEIALTQNATMGMSFLANGLDLAPGDEILTTDQEHPGGISPWLLRERRSGVVVKQLPLLSVLERGPEAVVELFANALNPRTRVLMFSHITSLLGIKLPAQQLCELARDRDVLSIVDGAQAVGQTRVDVKAIGCDAYVSSPHKWLCAPKGTGILYVRAPAQDRFWSTLVTTGFDDRSVGAFRFMRFGTGSMPAVFGLRAAARYMTRLTIERIERWDMMLTARLRDGLAGMRHVRLSSPMHPRFASAMTTFVVIGQSSDELQDELWKSRIRVRAEGDAGVRLSAHYYVAPADIDRVLDVVASLA